LACKNVPILIKTKIPLLFPVFLFILFLSTSTFALENDWRRSLPVTCRIEYSGNGTNSPVVSDEMIREIAEDAVMHPRKIHFDIAARMQIRIFSADGMNPMVEISFGQPQLKGNIHFRKFSLSDLLMPDRADFTIRIEKRDSVSSFLMFDVTNLKCSWNDSVILRRMIPSFSPVTDTVLIENLRVFYDKETLPPFRERVQLINDYYAANAVIDSLQVKYQEMDLGKLDNYPFYFITLEEMNKVLAILGERNFQQRLMLDSFDPLGFRVKYENLSRRSNSASMTFRENLKGSWVPGIRVALDSVIQDYLSGILRHIRWSMLVTERSSGIYKEYLERYFTTNAFGNDRKVVRDLINKWFPGENADTVMASVSRQMNRACHDKADTLMNNRQFVEASELLAHAGRFTRINPFLKESNDDRAIITKAANGIYDSFLGVAEGAIQYRKFEMAKSYLTMAQIYRGEHASIITSDSLLKKVFGVLVKERLSQCDTLYFSTRYSEALECYTEFERGFDSVTVRLIHADIEQKIRFCRYWMLMDQGLKKLVEADRPEAGRIFFLARQIEADGHFPADPVFDSLCRVTYPFYLVHLLYTGEEKIWTNQLGMARQFADSIAFIQRTTGLQNSRELSDMLARYRRKVEERSCWNANEAVEVLLVRAQTERELKDFILDAALTDSAVSLAEQFRDCVIPMTGVKDTVDKYAEAYEYQRMLKQIEIFVITGKFKESVNGYIELETYNRAHDIGRFGLSIQTMYDYIYNHSVHELTLQAFLYFQEKQYLTEAFRYLKLLRIQDYPRKSAKLPLEWLGKMLAVQDFQDRPDHDPVDLVRNYTGSDKWMKCFRASYFRQAAALRNQLSIKYIFRWFFS
jgi:hypothetical protein